jgi:hypothetical protein
MRCLPVVLALVLLGVGCTTDQGHRSGPSAQGPGGQGGSGGPGGSSGPGSGAGPSPSIEGTVVSWDGTTLALETADGRQTKVLGSKVQFLQKALASGTDLTVGRWVSVEGKSGSTWAATQITIRDTAPAMAGPPSGGPAGPGGQGGPQGGSQGGTGGPGGSGGPGGPGGPGVGLQGTVKTVSDGAFTVAAQGRPGEAASVTVTWTSATVITRLTTSSAALLKTGASVRIDGQEVVVGLAATAGTKPKVAVVEVTDRSQSLSSQMLESSQADTSALAAIGASVVTLNKVTVATGGNSSSLDNSSFVGQNAGLLARAGGRIVVTDSTIVTTGTGANGVFAYGTGSSVALARVTIDNTAQGAHAAMTAGGGSLNLVDVDMVTRGANSAAVATDRGGGTAVMIRGSILTSGADSPGLYSTGTLTVRDARITATGAEGAVIEGSNAISLEGTSVESTFEGKPGVMVYQSFSGDAEGQSGRFAMTGGSLVSASVQKPLFYVTNTHAVISLQGVALKAGSGVLVRAAADRWGNGDNGGRVEVSTSGQALDGDLSADKASTLGLVLAGGSVLTGAVNADGQARSASVELKDSSRWVVTKDSTVTVFTAVVTGATVAGLSGDGRVFYDRAANPQLAGKTYRFASGQGQLLAH